MKTIAWLDKTGKSNWNVFGSHSNYPLQLNYFSPIQTKWERIRQALCELRHTGMIEIWLVDFKSHKDHSHTVKPLRLLSSKGY